MFVFIAQNTSKEIANHKNQLLLVATVIVFFKCINLNGQWRFIQFLAGTSEITIGCSFNHLIRISTRPWDFALGANLGFLVMRFQWNISLLIYMWHDLPIDPSINITSWNLPPIYRLSWHSTVQPDLWKLGVETGNCKNITKQPNQV